MTTKVFCDICDEEIQSRTVDYDQPVNFRGRVLICGDSDNVKSGYTLQMHHICADGVLKAIGAHITKIKEEMKTEELK